MLRKTAILLGLVILWVTTAVSAAMTVGLSYTGVVNIQDGKPLVKSIVSVQSPGWLSDSNEGIVPATREGNVVQGKIPVPHDWMTQMEYMVQVDQKDKEVVLDYEVQFTDRTEIIGAYVSFLLPTTRFEGHGIKLYHSGQEAAFPKLGEDFGLNSLATAVSIELNERESLVIASDTTANIRVQDNRAYGKMEYELRFELMAERVLPEIKAKRRFVIAVVPNDEVDAVVQRVNPRTYLDPTVPYALVGEKGTIQIGVSERKLVNVYAAIHGTGWSYTTQKDAVTVSTSTDRSRLIDGSMQVPGTNRRMSFTQEAGPTEHQGLGVKYSLHFPEAVTLNGYQVVFEVPTEEYAGARVVLWDETGKEVTLTIPEQLGQSSLYDGYVTKLVVGEGTEIGFSLEVDEPTLLLIQDNRSWQRDNIEFRYSFRRDGSGVLVPAEERADRQFLFDFLEKSLQVVVNDLLLVSQTDTSQWIPYTLPWDAAPIDLSFLNHKPAGKYGWVVAEGDKFILSETGEEIRFWGINLSAGANFPTKEQARIIAKRLAQFGVNLVRIHHADAQWAERHLFSPQANHTRSFDRDSLDRLDYFIYCLKNEGIYIYLDQLVHRHFKVGDEVDAVDQLEPAAKPYSNFDERLIELQKEFSRNLWTHVNPYTGLAYKDDPAIVLMEFTNENDLFTDGLPITLEPYRTRLEQRYRLWAAENNVYLPSTPVDFTRKTDPLITFLEEVQRSYYQEMADYLRNEVGVRALMTGSNWPRTAALLASMRDLDFTDCHGYWNHATSDGSVENTPMLKAEKTVFDIINFQRVAGKPFFVSEWGEPWPNEWRAELTLWIAAIASFQEWNGLAMYTYRHSSEVPKTLVLSTFDSFNDPARFGLFPAAALLYRRGDLEAAQQKAALYIPEELAISASSPSAWSMPQTVGIVETHRLETALFQRPEDSDFVLTVSDRPLVTGSIRQSDTGQLSRDLELGILWIDSPRTQGVVGFLEEAGVCATADLTVECQSPFATIVLSSLTDEPISRSDQLLLTAVGRVENTGMVYNIQRTKVIAEGSGPILIDPIEATVTIDTPWDDLRIWALGPDGQRIGEVPTRYVDGQLIFTIGPSFKTMYYVIER